ncbi:MAG: ABC transporter ATP-binding protein [Clostridiales bacterium]|jgi:ABC-type lipoprotein export system ATPase subunit|nr:ABC transporter ATP-binding protein [Clostridiales bacterium]
MVLLNNVTKIYESGSAKTAALTDVNLSFPSKGLVFILGKSGSGKSTLLNVIAGLDGATGGEIFIDGARLGSDIRIDDYRNNTVGFVFQEFNLNKSLNVEQNILLSERLKNRPADTQKAAQALDTVGLSGKAKKKINQLSGGEQQRTAIARALIKDPKIIFADEPTGKLDEANGEIVFGLLKELSAKILVIAVSHDKESAEKYADRIIRLSDGRIVSDTVRNKDFIEAITVCQDTVTLPYGKKFSPQDAEVLNANKDKSVTISKAEKFVAIQDGGMPESTPAEEAVQVASIDNAASKRRSKSLKNKDAVYLALKNLFSRKIKTVASIAICVIMFAVFGLSAIIISYNEYQANARTFIKNNEGEIIIYQGAYNEWGGLIQKSGKRFKTPQPRIYKASIPTDISRFSV